MRCFVFLSFIFLDKIAEGINLSMRYLLLGVAQRVEVVSYAEIDISVSQSEIHVTIQKMEVHVDKSLSTEQCVILSDPPFKRK